MDVNTHTKTQQKHTMMYTELKLIMAAMSFKSTREPKDMTPNVP